MKGRTATTPANRSWTDLEELGLLVKIEDHGHNVGHCYRCSTVVEPIVSRQWFVSMQGPRAARDRCSS